jgi:transposase-like protein
MPWDEKQREKFVRDVKAAQETMSAVCRRYGISRKTGYKWLHRAEQGLPLSDESRAPHRYRKPTE